MATIKELAEKLKTPGRSMTDQSRDLAELNRKLDENRRQKLEKRQQNPPKTTSAANPQPAGSSPAGPADNGQENDKDRDNDRPSQSGQPLPTPQHHARPDGKGMDAGTENFLQMMENRDNPLDNPTNQSMTHLLGDLHSAEQLARDAERRGNHDQARRLRDWIGETDRWIQDNSAAYEAQWRDGNRLPKRVTSALNRHRQGFADREQSRQQQAAAQSLNEWLDEFQPRAERALADGFSPADKGSLAGEIDYRAQQARDAGLTDFADSLSAWSQTFRDAPVDRPPDWWREQQESPDLYDADPDDHPKHTPSPADANAPASPSPQALVAMFGIDAIRELNNPDAVNARLRLKAKTKGLYDNAVALEQNAQQLWVSLGLDKILTDIDNAYANGDIATGNALVQAYNQRLEQYLPAQEMARTAIAEYNNAAALSAQVGSAIRPAPSLDYRESPGQIRAKFGQTVLDQDGNPVPAINYAGLSPIPDQFPGLVGPDGLVSGELLKRVRLGDNLKTRLLNTPYGSSEIEGLPFQYQGMTPEQLATAVGQPDADRLTQRTRAIYAEVENLNRAAETADAELAKELDARARRLLADNEQLLIAGQQASQLRYSEGIKAQLAWEQEQSRRDGLNLLVRQHLGGLQVHPENLSIDPLGGTSIADALRLAGVTPSGNLKKDLGFLRLAQKRAADSFAVNGDLNSFLEVNHLAAIEKHIVALHNQQVHEAQVNVNAQNPTILSGFPTPIPQPVPYPAASPEALRDLRRRLEWYESQAGRPGQADDLGRFLKENPEITVADFEQAAKQVGNPDTTAWDVARPLLAPRPPISSSPVPQFVPYPVDRKPGFTENPFSATGQTIERLWEGSPAYWAQERRDQFLKDNPELAARAEELAPLISAIEADRHNEGNSYFLPPRPIADYDEFAAANPGASREDFYQQLAGTSLNAYQDSEPHFRVRRYLTANPGTTRDDLIFAAAIAGLPFFTDDRQANAAIQQHFLQELRGLRGIWQWDDNPEDYRHRFDYATNLVRDVGNGLALGPVSPKTLELVKLTNPWVLSSRAHRQNQVDEVFLTAATIPVGFGAGSVILRGGALGAKHLAMQGIRPLLTKPVVQGIGRVAGRTAGDTSANLLVEALPSHSSNRRWFDYTPADLLLSAGVPASQRIIGPGVRAGGRFVGELPYRAGVMLDQYAATGGLPTTTRQPLDQIYDILETTPGGTVGKEADAVGRAVARLEVDSQAVGLPWAQPGYVDAIESRGINIPGLMADKQAAMQAGAALGGSQKFLGPETGAVISTKQSPLNDYLVRMYGIQGIGAHASPTAQDWIKPGAVVNEGRMYNTLGAGTDRFILYDSYGGGGYGRGYYFNPAGQLHQSMHPYGWLMETNEMVRLAGDRLNPGQSIPMRVDWKPVGNLPLPWLRRPYFWRAIFDQEVLPPGGLSRADIRALNREARALRRSQSDPPGVWIEEPPAEGPLPPTPSQALLRARNLAQDNADLAVAPLPLAAAGEGEQGYLPPALAAALGVGMVRRRRWPRGGMRFSDLPLDHKPKRFPGAVINKENAYRLLNNPIIRLGESWQASGAVGSTRADVRDAAKRAIAPVWASGFTGSPGRETPATPPERDMPSVPPQRDMPAVPPQRDMPAVPPQREMPAIPPQRDMPAIPPQREMPAIPPQREMPAVPPQREMPAVPPQREMPAIPPQRDMPAVPPPRQIPPMPPVRQEVLARLQGPETPSGRPPMPPPRVPPREEPRTPPPPPPPRPSTPQPSVDGGDAARTLNPGAYPAEVQWAGVSKHTLDLNTGEHISVPLTGDNVASARVTRHQPKPTPEAEHRVANLLLQAQGGSVGLRPVTRKGNSRRGRRRRKPEDELTTKTETPKIIYLPVE